LLASCVGSVSRQQFEDESQARGGGLSQDVILDALVAVADDQGADPVQLRSVSVMPSRVSLEARVPGSPEDLDAYSFGTSGQLGGDGLDGPEPVARSSTEAPLESTLFTAQAAGVRRFDEMVDAALEEADLPGGYASGATITKPDAGAGALPQTVVTVTNVRRTVTVALSPDVSILGVQR